MKILVVSQYYYPEPFRIADICEQMVRDGHDVTVLTSQPNYPEGYIYRGYKNQYVNENINDVSVLRTKIYPRKQGNFNLFLNYISFVIYSRCYYRELADDYDIIFINQLSPIFSAIPAIKISRLKNSKTILYCLDMWPESLISGGVHRNSLVYRIFDFLSAKIYKSVDRIAITSKMFEEKFNKIGIEKIDYLPQYAESIFANTTNINNDYFDIVFAGNIGAMQSVETIVKAAGLLREYTDIKFHIVGDGSKKEDCVKLSLDLNLENIVFYGRKPIGEMNYYYSLADAMIVTLKDDELINYTLPGKVQSYMAAGKVIIAAARGETKKIINESKCGYVCEPDNPELLAKTILQCYKSLDNEEKHMNSYRYYINNFSKEKFFNRLYKIMEETLNV